MQSYSGSGISEFAQCLGVKIVYIYVTFALVGGMRLSEGMSLLYE